VTTWTLCSIPDALRALRDMRRVFRPGASAVRDQFIRPHRKPVQGVDGEALTAFRTSLRQCWSSFSGNAFLRGRDSGVETGRHVQLIGSRDKVGGAPFYISRPQYEVWKHTDLIIDVVPGCGGMFSLDNGRERRFLTRSEICAYPQADAKMSGLGQKRTWSRLRSDQ
jgi:uncharacterized protein (DUF779 family)